MDDGRVGQGDGGRGEELPDDNEEEDKEEHLQDIRAMRRILEEMESKGSLNDRCQLKNLNRKENIQTLDIQSAFLFKPYTFNYYPANY